MANWESQNISDVVKDIDDQKFVLPVIQRRLVWEEEKMELLPDKIENNQREKKTKLYRFRT